MSAPGEIRVEDEEDLDDLDDVLEQFNSSAAPNTQPSSQTATLVSEEKKADASKPSAPAKSPDPLGIGDLSDDFTRELTRGMESLMREIASESGVDMSDGKIPGGGEQTEEEKERARAFQEAWEKMLIEGMNGKLDLNDLTGGAPSKGKQKQAAPSARAASSSAPAEDNFQASIKKAMEKLKESDESLQADSSDPMEAMMAQLAQGMDGLGLGGDSEEELHKLLEGMMTTIMSKEVLYEPLKELRDKFPDYIKDNDATLSPDEKRRYNDQYAVVSNIVKVFEDPKYSDEDTEITTHVATLMNEMQSYGAPPADIMGPLPPGFDLGSDGLPKMPDGCTIA